MIQATKRKLDPNRHRGVAFYDRERMRKPLPPMYEPAGPGTDRPNTPIVTYDAPPSWVTLPESWGEWSDFKDDDGEPIGIPTGYFHLPAWPDPDEVKSDETQSTDDYVLKPCSVASRKSKFIKYAYHLLFANGDEFHFVNKPIAMAARDELLKIRKRYSKPPKYGGHSPDKPFFTKLKLSKLNQ